MSGGAETVLLCSLFINIRERAVDSVLPSLLAGSVLGATQPDDRSGWELWLGAEVGWSGMG